MIYWIENVSWEDLVRGRHFDAGDRAVLIQITDPAVEAPQPKFKFAEKYHFEFLDSDEDIPGSITAEQARDLVEILDNALARSMNVVVQCHAGMCRSGAVVEVGIGMGFTDTEKFRMPNLRVKSMMMAVLKS